MGEDLLSSCGLRAEFVRLKLFVRRTPYYVGGYSTALTLGEISAAVVRYPPRSSVVGAGRAHKAGRGKVEAWKEHP